MSTVTRVVAVALIDDIGRVLMHRRPLDKAHGGLWEFPGGKVEAGESQISAAFREISEELGVRLDLGSLKPLARSAEETGTESGSEQIVIECYTCLSWDGEPQCLEGEEIGWFDPADVSQLAMPPLDYPLAQALVKRLSDLGG